MLVAYTMPSWRGSDSLRPGRYALSQRIETNLSVRHFETLATSMTRAVDQDHISYGIASMASDQKNLPRYTTELTTILTLLNDPYDYGTVHWSSTRRD